MALRARLAAPSPGRGGAPPGLGPRPRPGPDRAAAHRRRRTPRAAGRLGARREPLRAARHRGVPGHAADPCAHTARPGAATGGTPSCPTGGRRPVARQAERPLPGAAGRRPGRGTPQRGPPHSAAGARLLPRRPAPPEPHRRAGRHPPRRPALPGAGLLPPPRQRTAHPRCRRYPSAAGRPRLRPTEIRAVLERTIPVPDAWVAARRSHHQGPEAWQEHPLLADLVLLEHDPARPRPVRLGRHLLRLDDALGLVHEAL
ncbi:hypothetical protein [Streptomyces sp. CA-132043]|uniref:hypothetical protein n=1 Tax=Streptomyces sp. CA-132043 TaxID=3240048 RepID=UPI003D8C5E2A